MKLLSLYQGMLVCAYLNASCAFVATVSPSRPIEGPSIDERPQVETPKISENSRSTSVYRKDLILQVPKDGIVHATSPTVISDAIFTIEENTLSSHSRIDDIAQLIKSQPKAGNRPRAVVCSAMGKTTLLCAGKLALEGRVCCGDAVRTIFNSTMRYYNMTGSVVKEVNELLDELEDILSGIRLLGELSPRSKDRLASFGERFSARLLSARLNQIGVPAYAFDAWDIGMFTTTEFGHAKPLPEAQDAIRKAFDRIDPSVVAVVPGGNGHEQEHHITTLGREGIHLTAKTIAAALKIKDIHGWGDVDGALARSIKHLGPFQ